MDFWSAILTLAVIEIMNLLMHILLPEGTLRKYASFVTGICGVTLLAVGPWRPIWMNKQRAGYEIGRRADDGSNGGIICVVFGPKRDGRIKAHVYPFILRRALGGASWRKSGERIRLRTVDQRGRMGQWVRASFAWRPRGYIRRIFRGRRFRRPG